jgi:sulfur-carrier protein adenylyltransferase/sulfurtransferase
MQFDPRYNCQVMLPGFGLAGQQKLEDAKVLVVGVGGLGCPASQYLVAAGVGTLAIADDDVVSTTNLHRQLLYTSEEQGQKKAVVAAAKLNKQNPLVKALPLDMRISSVNVMEVIAAYDIVVDCTDNFETRYLLNDACVLAGKPLVYGAIYQYGGQVAVWNVKNNDGTFSPNYRDLFPDVNAAMIPNCADGGVLPTLAGIIGCMQANEVIKYITCTGEILAGRLLMLDALTLQSRVVKMARTTKATITSITSSITIPTISYAELKSNADSYVLIDVRSQEEYNAFNIGGANIPVENVLTIDVKNFNKPVVLYCASGKRSGEAARLLLKKYPDAHILSLEGGIKSLG